MECEQLRIAEQRAVEAVELCQRRIANNEQELARARGGLDAVAMDRHRAEEDNDREHERVVHLGKQVHELQVGTYILYLVCM